MLTIDPLHHFMNTSTVIGARADRTERGSVYIFRKSGSALWVAVDTLAPEVTSDPFNVGNFGWSVAVYADYIVVGAPHEGVGSDKTGAMFIYREVATNTWVLQQKVIPADGGQGDRFGFSVDIHKSIIVVGARDADTVGAAYVYDLGGSLRQKLIPANAQGAAQYGNSVAISDGSLAVGAPRPSGIGSVYVYYLNENDTYILAERKVPENTGSGTGSRIEYGFSVAIAMNKLAVGSPMNDVAATDSGSVFTYLVKETDPC